VQAIAADPAISPSALHLIAAQAISAELGVAFERRRAETTNGEAPTTSADLLNAPIPTE
jgi:hypothetical protein